MPKTSEVYKSLYHYTNWDGLLGILKTKTLWATHYRFLNDSSEIALFRGELVSKLVPYVQEWYEKVIAEGRTTEQRINEEGGLCQCVRHNTEVHVDAMYHATGEDIYIVSFCGEHKNPNVNRNGLLSQWRGYGAGGGFALVFNTRELEKMLEKDREGVDYTHLSDVVYNDDVERFNKELSEDLSAVVAGAEFSFLCVERGKLGKQDARVLSQSHWPFVNCITRYKHCGFHEENEVRIVSLPSILDQKTAKGPSARRKPVKRTRERKFRYKNNEYVPYIELFEHIGTDLPIERIIVGPHTNREARAAALQVMLRGSTIKVTCSDIPYVS